MNSDNNTRTQVQEFYDRNTQAFIARGQGGYLGAIHRAVWGPGVTTEAGAFTYLERRIAELFRELGPGKGHVVDLGCGVGASMCLLAELTQAHFSGITLTHKKAELAQQRIAAHQLQDRVKCIQGDYCQLPEHLPSADLAYAIESFLHTPDAEAFFRNAAGLVRPGGKLVICDDFLTGKHQDPNRWVERFREGWHAPKLMPDSVCVQLADAAGFELNENDDLTAYLQLGRPRDWAIAGLMHCVGWLPIAHPQFQMLRGGHALQRCLQRDLLNFRLLAFTRRHQH